MSANVESMFYVRKPCWHGMGVRVEEALTSKDALHYSGLDWQVKQEPLMTGTFKSVPGYVANVRSDNDRILGIVSDSYKVVQNEEAFAFTDALIGEGVRYETAGSLDEGRKVWLLAKLPERYQLVGEDVDPYIVFTSSHDGSGAIRVAPTPIRVVCQNTLNLALNTAKRSWSTTHTSNVHSRLDDARNTLLFADKYMKALQQEAERLSMQRVTDKLFYTLVDKLLPVDEDASEQTKSNNRKQRSDLIYRYFHAPDLVDLPKNGWRFINAVSDHATHAQPLRMTKNYRENLFDKVITGHPMTDKAMKLLVAV
ncbi:MAG: DUF945 domain-containing protein [Peptococcaceae bacterium]|nr:DUF945 domain-containing protein [Peptococcaceae bacterium]